VLVRRIHKETLLSELQTDGLVGALLADRFRIDRLIGTGGMAAVYEATDVSLGRTVAVKLFRTDTADDTGPERESGEISVLASLNHFALVTLFDAGTAEINGAARTFIVMEFVDGSDLRSRILPGPLRPGEVAEMGADLAEALHYVHSKGIIHRDIKPANVLLAPSEFPGRTAHAKLADFGIARLFDGARLTATGALLGTASYLSPEQALGRPLGPPSDVYSLGLVLLECLTGERAFPGTAVESAMARLQRQPEIPARLGAEWGTLLAGMTTREPADRFSALDAAVSLRGLSAADTGEADTVLLSAGTDSTAPMQAADAAGEARTRLLPAAAQAGPGASDAGGSNVGGSDPTAATVFLGVPPGGLQRTRTEPAASGSAVRGRPRLPRRAVLAIAAGALVLVAVLALVFAQHPAEPVATPPTYPAVGGTLGTHLTQLQESVNP
jgi:hypothetical protein